MSDFLTRMAQLSRGEATVVTPRLPSVFVSTVDVGLSEMNLVNRQQQNQTVPATDTSLTDNTAFSDVVVDRETHQATPMVEQPAAEPLYRELITIKRDTKEHTSGSMYTPLHDTPVTPVAVTSSTNEALNTRSIGQDDNLSASGTENSQTLVPVTTDIAHEAPAELNEQPGIMLAQASLPLVPDYQSQQPAPQQFFTELPTTEPAAPQQPTVHINIGRIEVRAHTAAPTSTPRPARPKPQRSLTLDDYLKRGGGRS